MVIKSESELIQVASDLDALAKAFSDTIADIGSQPTAEHAIKLEQVTKQAVTYINAMMQFNAVGYSEDELPGVDGELRQVFDNDNGSGSDTQT